MLNYAAENGVQIALDAVQIHGQSSWFTLEQIIHEFMINLLSNIIDDRLLILGYILIINWILLYLQVGTVI